MQAIKSSPFKINVVSFGMLLFNMFDINSVCAFLIIESRNKFVHIKYVGFTYGYIFIELLSSISSIARSFLWFPFKFASFINVDAIPEFVFEPK